MILDGEGGVIWLLKGDNFVFWGLLVSGGGWRGVCVELRINQKEKNKQ